jgi:hypothetical protein
VLNLLSIEATSCKPQRRAVCLVLLSGTSGVLGRSNERSHVHVLSQVVHTHQEEVCRVEVLRAWHVAALEVLDLQTPVQQLQHTKHC